LEKMVEKFERIDGQTYKFKLRIYMKPDGTRRADLTNMKKAIEDALEGTLYSNDFWCVKDNCEIILADETYFTVEVEPYEQKDLRKKAT